MNRNQAVEKALACFDDGRYLEDLRRRVAIPTESQEAATRMPDLYRYLIEEIGPCFAAMGYEWRIFDNPFPSAGPVLLAERIEGDALTTVLGYGLGDVLRVYDEQCRCGRSEEHLSELQSPTLISYSVFSSQKKTTTGTVWSRPEEIN